MNQIMTRPWTAQFDTGQIPTITCINQASLEFGVAWETLVAALEKFANEVFAPVWGTPARIVDGGTGPDVPRGSWAMVFLDDADQPSALGYHDLTPDGLPLSKIFVRTTLQNQEKVSVTASHELAEMLVDPGIQMGALGPDGTTWYAYETADAVEREEFDVDGVAMSNFVYPSWFEGFRPPSSTRFDHLNRCSAPFQLLAGGYMPVFRNGTWSQIFGSEEARRRFNLSSHPRAQSRPRAMRHRSSNRYGPGNPQNALTETTSLAVKAEPPLTAGQVSSRDLESIRRAIAAAWAAQPAIRSAAASTGFDAGSAKSTFCQDWGTAKQVLQFLETVIPPPFKWAVDGLIIAGDTAQQTICK